MRTFEMKITKVSKLKIYLDNKFAFSFPYDDEEWYGTKGIFNEFKKYFDINIDCIEIVADGGGGEIETLYMTKFNDGFLCRCHPLAICHNGWEDIPIKIEKIRNVTNDDL